MQRLQRRQKGRKERKKGGFFFIVVVQSMFCIALNLAALIPVLIPLSTVIINWFWNWTYWEK